MTRKDYELIANVLRYNGLQISEKDRQHSFWAGLCLDMADDLATTNPRFDREKFLKACGMKEAVYVNSKNETVYA